MLLLLSRRLLQAPTLLGRQYVSLFTFNASLPRSVIEHTRWLTDAEYHSVGASVWHIIMMFDGDMV